MTVCYEMPAPLGRYTIEYDREAPWHSQWVLVFARTISPRRVKIRRYFTYTEARKALISAHRKSDTP